MCLSIFCSLDTTPVCFQIVEFFEEGSVVFIHNVHLYKRRKCRGERWQFGSWNIAVTYWLTHRWIAVYNLQACCYEAEKNQERDVHHHCFVHARYRTQVKRAEIRWQSIDHSQGGYVGVSVATTVVVL